MVLVLRFGEVRERAAACSSPFLLSCCCRATMDQFQIPCILQDIGVF